MENKKKRGRPKKTNAKKVGELKKGLRRFTFIANEKMVLMIKKSAKIDRLSVKDFMAKVIDRYFHNPDTDRDDDLYSKVGNNLLKYKKGLNNF